MKKGQKVKTDLMLLGKRPVKIEGRVQDIRNLFGREEVLVDIQKMEPVWITLNKIQSP